MPVQISAAVQRTPNSPPQIETLTLEEPRAGEVRYIRCRGVPHRYGDARSARSRTATRCPGP
jgi:Zn-dependent alcohol dehydrogenase